ncbi:MAG: glutathione S-transferase family protein [Proteobacteria bacterium]|nr:glutathione S-transferase family protein [Pseudomonadota bacterium]
MDKLDPAKLYYIDGSPFARLCRILIDEWQLPVQEVEIPFPLSDDFFKINPMGQVPVLETIGEMIFPTAQIVEQLWAMTVEPTEPYLDPLADRQLLSTLIGMGDFMVTANQQVWAGLEPSGEDILGFNPGERHQERVYRCLDWMEARAQHWLTGDEPNVCDYALACFLFWSDSRRPIEWRNRTKLASIVDRLRDRPSFMATIPEPWSSLSK